jgi:hypothetical protein
MLKPSTLHMAFNGGLLLGQFDSSESAEEEVRVVLVRDEIVLVVLEVELRLHSSSVGFRLQILLEVVESGEELVLGQLASDLAVLNELEVGVGAHQLLQLGLLALFLGLGWLSGSHRGGLLGVVGLYHF